MCSFMIVVRYVVVRRCEEVVVGYLKCGEGVCCGLGEDVGRGGQGSRCQLVVCGEVVYPGGEGCQWWCGGRCGIGWGWWCGGCGKVVEEEGVFEGGGKVEDSSVCSAQVACGSGCFDGEVDFHT